MAAAKQGSTPHISGPWQVVGSIQSLRTSDGKVPPLRPEAQTIYAKHIAARQAGDATFDPMTKCLPPGVPRLMLQPFPFSIVQGKTMVGFVFEWNHLNRVVYLNQQHFEAIGPLYLGQSVGHWEGNTLVVDTNNYNDLTLLDDAGIPHSEDLRTVERIRLTNGGAVLEDRIRFEDAKTFTRPWEAVVTFNKKTDVTINEDYCLGRTGQGRLTQK